MHYENYENYEKIYCSAIENIPLVADFCRYNSGLCLFYRAQSAYAKPLHNQKQRIERHKTCFCG